MELVVYENSYITLDEADKIINKRYLSTSNIKQFWDSLDDDNKTVIILATTEKYDNNSMLYKGCKQSISQPMQYPRVDTYKNIIECPEKIKVGLLMQGLREIMSSNTEEEQLKELGVHSFSDGSGASVTFESNKKIKNRLGIYFDIWRQYFADFSYLC